MDRREGAGGRARSAGRRWPWVVACALVLVIAAGAAGCALVSGEFEPHVATSEMAAESLTSRFLAVGDGRVHYVFAGGPGAPVVFVHGSPGTWDAWRGYLRDPELSGLAALVALDRPGFGGSERGRAVASLEQQAAAVAAVVEAVGGGAAVVVGHSLGGPIAARLACDRPELVRGLVLVAPSLDPELERRRWFNVAGSLRAVQWFLPVDLITSNREIWPLREELEALAPRLARIAVPTIVVQGGRDTLVAPANAEFAARALTGAQVEVRRYPEATHFLVWERPALVRDAVVDLLARLAGTAR